MNGVCWQASNNGRRRHNGRRPTMAGVPTMTGVPQWQEPAVANLPPSPLWPMPCSAFSTDTTTTSCMRVELDSIGYMQLVYVSVIYPPMSVNNILQFIMFVSDYMYHDSVMYPGSSAHTHDVDSGISHLRGLIICHLCWQSEPNIDQVVSLVTRSAHIIPITIHRYRQVGWSNTIHWWY